MKITYAISTETDFEAYARDTLFLAPMDAGYLAFILQTSDLKLIVRTFARLASDTQSQQNVFDRAFS
jgi:ABC-type thiamine transport system substrate-binding protein